MDSTNKVWEMVLDMLSKHLTETAYNTWFADCTAIDLGENQLVLHTTSAVKRDIIEARYGNLIKQALYELFSCPFELKIIMGEDELIDYKEQRPSEDDMPELEGYTFDHFVVGPSNRFAHGAALGAAQNPGTLYNPLYIYGNSGLGKTHLLLAIGQYIRQNDPATNLVYVKAEEFINHMVRSLQTGAMESFRQKYRSADLLLVDDIQFFSGKEQMQEEFFHTYEALYNAHKQIVLTSDRPPREMRNLNDRLRSRFEGGILADVAPPDLETRMAITRNKAAQVGMVLPDETVHYIAEKITSNVRQIEGVVKKLTAYHNIDKSSAFNNAAVDRAIKDVIRSGIYIPTPEIIIEETARYYQLDGADLRGKGQNQKTSLARQIAMYLIKTNANLTLNQIGVEFGRNHSTVHTSITKIEELLKSDPDVASTIQDITSNIHSRN